MVAEEVLGFRRQIRVKEKLSLLLTPLLIKSNKASNAKADTMHTVTSSNWNPYEPSLETPGLQPTFDLNMFLQIRQ